MTRQLTDGSKRGLLMLADALTLSAALWLAVTIRHGEVVDVQLYWWLFPTAALAGVAAFAYFDLYRAIVRYIGPSAMLPALLGVSIAAIAIALTAYLSGAATFPRSAVIIFWFLALALIGAGRFLVRAYFYGLFNNYLLREPVAIYGGGEAGAQLAMSLLNGNEYMPVAFLDDDARLDGKIISGVRVHHADKGRKALMADLGVRRVLLAMPSLSSAQRARVLNKLAELPVQVHTVPPMRDILAGAASVAEVRAIDLGDLLGRDLVPPDEALLSQAITGKNILVTGAAGTIGAEICRKIIARRPGRLLLCDSSEYGLYQLEPELRRLKPEGTELGMALGSILTPGHLQQTLASHAIETVYHAAAYKHVPLVERNVIEGVRNNVLGSFAVARAVEASRATELVMVSSDKAVKPASVMGASKRLAEMVVQGFAANALASGSGKRYCTVRFGNVLRSSGSVVPLFEEQINAGGPVTVTHAEATRYFMTCSEAAELVIQAGVMAEGGEVFVLDMGKPVPILELAEKMIHLNGKEVGEDPQDPRQIAIQFTGLRLGEKLHEELMEGEPLTGTRHPQILRAEEAGLGWEPLLALCEALEAACAQGDTRQVKALLERHVAGCHLAGGGQAAASAPGKVMPLKRQG